MNIDAIIQGISIWALPVLFAIVLHEVAHGWMADRLGDNTARFMGRLTLNPLKHIDPIGTILIPVVLLVAGSPFLFGYAKPVPVNFGKLNHPKRDMIWVALAGPITNLVLALLSTLLLALTIHMPASLAWVSEPLSLMCQASIIINLVLFIFNLLPLPSIGWRARSGRPVAGAFGLSTLPYRTIRFFDCRSIACIRSLTVGGWPVGYGWR